MKLSPSLHLFVLAVTLSLTNCTSVATKSATSLTDNLQDPASQTPADPVDEYATQEVSDPLEPLNRATFWINDGLYTILLRPISKGYEKILPSNVREGIDNVFDNAKFPVRLVNSALQCKLKRAGQETGKFLINTIAGVGGMIRQSDRIPSLVDVPAEDTAQTFAQWGIGHGTYLVLPLLGPSSVRDTVGLAGDYAMNPINWGMYAKGAPDWAVVPPAINTLRSLPGQLSDYDDATKDAIDPYLSARSTYIQNRAEAVRE